MADLSRHPTDFTTHPDSAEMRERYARVLRGPQAALVDGLVLLTGLYLAISPWIVGFSATSQVTVNNLVLGVAVAVVGLGLTAAPERMYGLSWAALAVGAWEIISPWVIGETANDILWNNIVTGGLIALWALVASGMLAASVGLPASRRADTMR